MTDDMDNMGVTLAEEHILAEPSEGRFPKGKALSGYQMKTVEPTFK